MEKNHRKRWIAGALAVACLLYTSYDEIFYYIKNNVDAVKDDLALMVSGQSIPAKIWEYAATSQELKTKEQIFSAMVVYGFLSYEDGEVFIPNRCV